MKLTRRRALQSAALSTTASLLDWAHAWAARRRRDNRR